MKVGPCISDRVGSSDQNASNTLRRATVAASAIVPPVSAFESVTISGTTPAASSANSVPVRPKPVKISSKISSSSIAVGERAQPAQDFGFVEQHAARALHQRLDDDAGECVGVALEMLFERGRARRVARQIEDVVARQQSGKEPVHPLLRVRHRHRAGGVAVIAAAEGDEAGAAVRCRD